MKILFLCTGNAARSLMAEAFMRSLLPPVAPIEVFSAGTHPKGVHPTTAATLREVGIDTTPLRSKGIAQVPFAEMDVVVTLCDDARSACPATPPQARRIHWGLRDPATATGTPEESDVFAAVRDEILTCVKRLLFELARDPALRPRKG